MGTRVKGGKLRFFRQSEEYDEPARSHSVASDDDDEANEDLSLKIVEMAISMRATKMALALRDEDALEEGICGDVTGSSSQGEGGVVESKGKKKEKKEKKEKEKKEKKKKKEKVDNGEGGELNLIALNDGETAEADKAAEGVESVKPIPVETTDNAVMRKLLRVPRYFDPSDSNWGTCYNCGGEGHLAVNCTSQKKKRPCFVCGSVEHGAKQCKKAQDCFICKRSGHHAKNCPDKQKASSLNGRICLKCGESAHEMFSCTGDYPAEDLKAVQCYICQEFGHLCCPNPVDPDPSGVSCYKCGELGHTGLACGSSRKSTTGESTPSSCFKCGEEGHLARECRNSSKPHKSKLTEGLSSRSCHKCGDEGHFARECSSSNWLSTLTPENCGGKGHFPHEGRCSTQPLSSIFCYKCGEGGHFARECSSMKAYASNSNVPINGVIASLCYKCGGGGHFARECQKSNESSYHSANGNKCSAKLISPTLCYNCGESGHFTRECRNIFKGNKMERRLSTTSPGHWQDYDEPISILGSAVKSCKRKKSEQTNSSRTPQIPKHRGGWITDDPGDFSSGNLEKVWDIPSTRGRKTHGNFATKSPGSGKASWHSSRFRDNYL